MTTSFGGPGGIRFSGRPLEAGQGKDSDRRLSKMAHRVRTIVPDGCATIPK